MYWLADEEGKVQVGYLQWCISVSRAVVFVRCGPRELPVRALSGSIFDKGH